MTTWTQNAQTHTNGIALIKRHTVNLKKVSHKNHRHVRISYREYYVSLRIGKHGQVRYFDTVAEAKAFADEQLN